MKAYALTDVGRVRQINQDYQFASTESVGPLSNLFIVADGMGGHKAGDYASRYLVEHLVSYIKECDDGSAVSAINNGIAKINRELYEQSLTNTELAGMGTTIVAATIEDSTLYVANVGDSRLYLIEREGISQITRDHSFVEEMVSMGQMDRGSSEYKEKKNIITRAVGIGRKVDVDFFEVPLKPGDYILLCSDGLTNMVDNSAIFRLVLLPGSLQMKARALVALANQNGGRDNIAVILADPQISEVNPL
ncbi:Stp1/IreP family PP2C-type Ser/Thr phosphatase [Clostridium transplantifaecale]|uniref:Stp1/IreP family PP2C-type Ser/Thr phosphatase n=1 Tax=Clostridium transplantifaecale TaxID=2479838 RepID=UPI000F6436AF|nr:Stp1/IreP family PP2C-type Ser/Thr phosphatase [Clostridium transplantifaecale]